MTGAESFKGDGGAAGPTAATRRDFSPRAKERIQWLYSRYPVRLAALLPILRLAEEEFGTLDNAAVACVANEMGISPSYVYGVLSFYTHYRRNGDGKYVLQVCSTLPCALRGCREVTAHLENRLGIAPGQTTPDGKFTLKKVECLASCDTAPVVQINDDYHENLTLEKLDRILEGLS